MTSGTAPHQGSRHGIVDAVDTQRIKLDHVQHHWGQHHPAWLGYK
jgi:hypothetical protein